VFFTIYASSGLVACGKLFASTFGISYATGVWVGGLITVVYTLMGGFRAVCWTDVFQGSLMVLALVVVPTVAFAKAGGAAGVQEAARAREMSLCLLGILSTMAWGLGYFGQPHLLVRFMSARSLPKLSESMRIAIAWVALSLTGAVMIGLIGIGLFPALPGGDSEKVFLRMIAEVIPSWAAGIMLSAILSAIMSTIDSQLLVSSSALSEDLYHRIWKRDAGRRDVVLIGRICVIAISATALGLALRPDDTILGIVAYAWGGFGAAFGPLILFALFSRRTTWLAALLGMLVGTLVLVAWRQVGLNEYLYEIVPGFAANSLVILVVNRIARQENVRVLQQFDDVARELRGTGRPAAAPQVSYGTGDGAR
jgi:sodium/proline symporter